MDPRDFFRGLFRPRRPPQNRPRDQEDEDEDQDFLREDSFNNSSVEVFTNPLEMERFFSHQMEDMMRNFFGGGGFNPGMGLDRDQDQNEGCRDFMLKEGSPLQDGGGYAHPDGTRKDRDVNPEDVSPDQLHQLYQSTRSNEGHQDHSHGRHRSIFSADPFFNFPFFGGGPRHQEGDFFNSSPEFGSGQGFAFGQSSSSSFVRNPDGSTEEKRTVKDSCGNTKTTITRRSGGQTFTKTIVKRPDGYEDVQESGNPDLALQTEPSLRDKMMKRDKSNFDSMYERFFGPKH